MLYTVAIVLLILWALGLVSSYTIGGFIHVLLVIAIVVILIRVIGGRSPV
ncbi:MAG: lmo0937 family membrane protein [Betaproteobacteria bacterium]|nr:MAG: lmo0937 family membrane protein [Betaproteobacteria bacterium]